MPISSRLDTRCSFGGERLATAKLVLRPSDHPTQTRLQWRDAGAELVPVQRQRRPRGARCHARPRPAGVTPAPVIAAHRSAARGVRHGDLDAGLARVAGAGHHAVDALPREAADLETTDGRSIGEAPSPAAPWRAGPARQAPLGRGWSRRRRSLTRTRSVLRRVGHDVEDFVVDPPDDDVVEHRGIDLVEQMRVLRPAGGDLVRGRW